MIGQEPERWMRVDARQSTANVQAAIRRCLEERQVLERDGGTG
jgi:thymidylate kinase